MPPRKALVDKNPSNCKFQGGIACRNAPGMPNEGPAMMKRHPLEEKKEPFIPKGSFNSKYG